MAEVNNSLVIGEVIKYPQAIEERVVAFLDKDQNDAPITLGAVTVWARDIKGADATATVIDYVAFSGHEVQIRFKAGISGQSYTVFVEGHVGAERIIRAIRLRVAA